MGLKMNFPLLSDQRIKFVPIVENGDLWIDLKDQTELLLDHSREQIQKISANPFLVRESVYLKLVHAQQFLPQGFKFQIKECYRPLWVQKKFYKDYTRFLKTKFSEYTNDEIEIEASKYLAPISVAPHSTGGAVDLVLIGHNSHAVEMGTEFNASPVKTGNRTYTDSLDISDEAKLNRRILNTAMQSAGFVNYPTEWWHWSYGDQYWAYMTKSPNSLFQRRPLKFEIRGATIEDAEDIAKINIESWKTTYRGIVNDTFLDGLNYQNRLPGIQKGIQRPEVKIFVAIEKESNKKVGFSMYGPCREKNIDADFELYAIYLYEEFQGFGAGKLLFDEGYKAFKEMNYNKMMVSVLAKNKPSCLFYEKMGGQAAEADHVDLGNQRYPTATYVWSGA